MEICNKDRKISVENNMHSVSTQFFDREGRHLLTIPDHFAPNLRKGSIVYLASEDHTKKDFESRRNSLPSGKWVVRRVSIAVREMIMGNNTPSTSNPTPFNTSGYSTLEVEVRPYRYWTIGLSSHGRNGPFFDVDHNGRFIRIGRLYIGLGYV